MIIRIIIAGSRTFSDYNLLKCYSDSVLQEFDLSKIVIICGGAKGADQLATKYAEEHNLELKVVPPDWALFGKAAGFVRNAAMVEYADVLIAFWNGKSKGTEHVIDLAKLRGLKTHVRYV